MPSNMLTHPIDTVLRTRVVGYRVMRIRMRLGVQLCLLRKSAVELNVLPMRRVARHVPAALLTLALAAPAGAADASARHHEVWRDT